MIAIWYIGKQQPYNKGILFPSLHLLYLEKFPFRKSEIFIYSYIVQSRTRLNFRVFVSTLNVRSNKNEGKNVSNSLPSVPEQQYCKFLKIILLMCTRIIYNFKYRYTWIILRLFFHLTQFLPCLQLFSSQKHLYNKQASIF